MIDKHAKRHKSEDRGRMVSERIRQARIAEGLSQKELGKLYGCSASAISQLERDATGIGVERLESLARILRRPLYWFFEDRVESEPRYLPHPLTSLHDIERWLSKFIPVYDRVVVRGKTEPVDWFATSRIMNPGPLRAYEVAGLSCEPEVKEGDLIIVDLELSPQSGDTVLGVVNGKGVLGKCEEDEEKRKSYRYANTVYSDDLFQVVGVALGISRLVIHREVDFDKAAVIPSSHASHRDAAYTVLGVTYQQAVANLQAWAALNATITTSEYPVGGGGRITWPNHSKN